MNNTRRKRLAQAAALLEQAKEIVEEVGSDETDAFDNLPEGLQAGEKGEAMSEVADTLVLLEGDFDAILGALDEITGGMRPAAPKKTVIGGRFLDENGEEFISMESVAITARE